MKRARTAAVLVASGAVALSGCGSRHSKVDRGYVDVEFSAVNLRISSDVLNNADDLEPATRAYIGLIRKYRSVLGDDEVKRRLAAKADQLQDWCLPCVEMLDRERQL